MPLDDTIAPRPSRTVQSVLQNCRSPAFRRPASRGVSLIGRLKPGLVTRSILKNVLSEIGQNVQFLYIRLMAKRLAVQHMWVPVEIVVASCFAPSCGTNIDQSVQKLNNSRKATRPHQQRHLQCCPLVFPDAVPAHAGFCTIRKSLHDPWRFARRQATPDRDSLLAVPQEQSVVNVCIWTAQRLLHRVLQPLAPVPFRFVERRTAMTKTRDAPASRQIVGLCRAIRKTWRKQKRHQRRELAIRRQSVLFSVLVSSPAPPAGRAA